MMTSAIPSQNQVPAVSGFVNKRLMDLSAKWERMLLNALVLQMSNTDLKLGTSIPDFLSVCKIQLRKTRQGLCVALFQEKLCKLWSCTKIIAENTGNLGCSLRL